MGEVAAGKIGRGVGLDPGNVVEELEAELLHGEADAVDDVGGAGDPDGAVGFEDPLGGGEPGAVEFVIRSGPRDLSQAPLLTETILPAWQVMPPLERKYGGSAKTRSTGFGDGLEDFEAVALVDAEVVFFVVEGGSGEGGHL